MVVTRRIPEDVVEQLDSKTFRIDNIYHKVNLAIIPEGVYTKERTEIKKVVNPNGGMTEEKIKHQVNTNEKALVRLRIPLREQTASEFALEHPPKDMGEGELGAEPTSPKEGEEVKQPEEKLESEQDKEESAKMVEEN